MALDPATTAVEGKRGLDTFASTNLDFSRPMSAAEVIAEFTG